MAMEVEASHIIDSLLFIAVIWFTQRFKKPPDKDDFTEITSDLMQIIGVNSYYVGLCTHVARYIYHHIFSRRNSSESGNTPENPIMTDGPFAKLEDESAVLTQVMNKPYYRRYSRSRRVLCNVSVWTAAKRKMNSDNSLNIDADGTNFAVDTCTTDTICRDKTLYVGKIRECGNIRTEGVGGHIKARGVGTIKF